MSTSAGIIPYRINNGHIEFFVGHPGSPYWKNNPYYAFLKGGLEEGEDSFMAAIREFKEESGLSLPSVPFISLGAVKQNSKKTVYAYGVLFDIDPEKCFSNECEVEHPSNSGIKIKIPEIDKYAWMTFDKLKEITNKNHLLFYKEIINYERNHGLYKGIMDENGNIINEK